MRLFHVDSERFTELSALPAELPARGFLWLGYGRKEFEQLVGTAQAALQRWDCGQLVDLHVSDLIHPQLPSPFDYPSWYDLLVFRRLAAVPAGETPPAEDDPGNLAAAERALKAIDTSPVGFAVFDRVLLTFHPADCLVPDFFAHRPPP